VAEVVPEPLGQVIPVNFQGLEGSYVHAMYLDDEAPVAVATMDYKHRTLDSTPVKTALSAPNFLLKIVPHVDGTARICELVRYFCEDVTVKGAWTGPAALELFQHALAPVARLPVLEVLSGVHIVSNLTLGLGTVVHDYLS
jgi:acetoacetate decarboxylase